MICETEVDCNLGLTRQRAFRLSRRGKIEKIEQPFGQVFQLGPLLQGWLPHWNRDVADFDVAGLHVVPVLAPVPP